MRRIELAIGIERLFLASNPGQSTGFNAGEVAADEFVVFAPL